MIQLRGAFTALITPMKETGAVDYEGFRRLINFQLEAGIDGLVPLGTTGETPTLEQEEKDTLLQIAVKEAKGQVPIIVGTGSNVTKHTIEYTKHVKSLGADAALVVTPYYNKPNDSGLLRHFEATAQQGGLPIVVYNIASRTGRNIPAPLMQQVSQIPGIIGVKESSGDITQMGDIIREARDRRNAEAGPFRVLSGDDGFTLPLLALGGDGVISVVSNLVPDKLVALTKAGLEGNFAECRRLHYELLPFIKAAFIETNPIPIKTAMTWAGLPGGPVRLPLGPLSKRSEPLLKAALEDLGFTLSGF